MTIRILNGDVREQLANLPAGSFDCIVTSPPYWGLRDYGTAKWEGGSAECDHLGPPMRTNNKQSNGAGTFHGGMSWANEPMGRVCSKCGARRVDNQIGLEPTLTEYLDTMVAVCRDLRRVLKPSGTFWLNVGDSYAGNAIIGRNDVGTSGGLGRHGGNKEGSGNPGRQGTMQRDSGLKPKDLCMVPNRLAIRLQEDGWYVRSEIIWHKPNPMPESVTDRPTSSHEKIWLLTKAERYWYDADAIRESDSGKPSGTGFVRDERLTYAGRGDPEQWLPGGGRNSRNVWTIASQPYSEAHFATFPPELAERCIKAGCPVGGTVLDPFGGAGTSGLVADRLGRDATLIELNPNYVSLIKNRIADDAGMFAQVAAE
jgi:DNA modification methylase